MCAADAQIRDITIDLHLRNVNRFVFDVDVVLKVRKSKMAQPFIIEIFVQLFQWFKIVQLAILDNGTNVCDQCIDYRLVTPLRGKKSPGDPTAASAVGLDEKGQTRLFLKITGTTEDYRIQYDTESVKKKIISDMKNEVKELRDAFRSKETQKKKELELQEDEYFEWDE